MTDLPHGQITSPDELAATEEEMCLLQSRLDGLLDAEGDLAEIARVAQELRRRNDQLAAKVSAYQDRS